MRVLLALGIGFSVLAAAACSSSSTSPANSCGSSGANTNVNTTSSNSFSPASIPITHGQSVCWQSGNVLHTVTDNGGAFDVDLPVGQIFVHTYPAAGTYPYHCKIHAGMTGTVIVN